jgi:hypothetical protein
MQWAKFAGVASQWAIALVVLMYAGKYVDAKWQINAKTPVFIWLFPFLFIVFSLFKIIKDTKTK